MSRALLLTPIAGIVITIAVPLLRYGEKQRQEETAVDVVQHVRLAQQTFRRHWGGYATDLARLVGGCANDRGPLDQRVVDRLTTSGYHLELRATVESVPVTARGCAGSVFASDYYVSAQPIDAARAGQQAFAARADGEIYLFYDGLAPNEAQIASGLATSLHQRSAFRIP